MKDLQNFKAKYYSNELRPFFASQPVPIRDSQSEIWQLVGANYAEFLSQDEVIKVVYLYSTDKSC